MIDLNECGHPGILVNFRPNGLYSEETLIRAECGKCGAIGPYRKTNHFALQALRKGLKK